MRRGAWLGLRLASWGRVEAEWSGSGWAQRRAAFSTEGGGAPKNIIQRLADSVKEELAKDARLKEQLSKLRAEKEELNNTEAMQAAREKYRKVELESFRQTDVVKEKVAELSESIRKALATAADSEMGRRVAESSREVAESLSKAAEKVGDTAAAQKVAQGMRVVSTEIDSITAAQMYRAPETLQTRAHFSSVTPSAQAVEPDNESSGLVVHKDARWYTGIRSWYDTSPTVEKLMDLKLKYEESDSRLARIARFFTDGIQSAVYSTTGSDVSTVLTEIAKVDPSFDKDEFCRFVGSVVVPNVMEGQVRGDLGVLEDWLHEVPFRQLSAPIKQNSELGFDASASKVLDTSRIELLTGKMMEQGPVFIVSFSAHIIDVLKNREGKVISGDPDKVIKMNHVWALCRDMQVLDPNAAWKVLEIHASPTPLYV